MWTITCPENYHKHSALRVFMPPVAAKLVVFPMTVHRAFGRRPDRHTQTLNTGPRSHLVGDQQPPIAAKVVVRALHHRHPPQVLPRHIDCKHIPGGRTQDASARSMQGDSKQ